MSLLFFKRVLANPLRVGYVVPSSPFLTRQTARRIDFSQPRVVVGSMQVKVPYRQIVKRMNPDSRLILFELDEIRFRIAQAVLSGPSRCSAQAPALHLPEH
jgi:phospholipid N-methyltransferase